MAIYYKLETERAVEAAKARGAVVERRASGSWVEVEFAGAVLQLGEHNYYDDSDFYAVVYDAEAGTIHEVEYATTRFGGGGWAEVDVTAENRERAGDLCEAEWLRLISVREEREARKLAFGREVVVVRGKKVPVGTVGEVAKIGRGRYGDWVLIRLIDGETVITDAKNVEVVNPGQYEKTDAEKAAEARRERYNWAVTHHLVVAAHLTA